MIVQMERQIKSRVIHQKEMDYRLIWFEDIEDQLDVYEFIKRCMSANSFDIAREDVEALSNDVDTITYIVLKSDTPIGFCIADINPKPNCHEGVKILQIKHLGILEEYRQMGYGRAVLEDLLELGQINGMKKAGLQVRLDNPAAMSLCKKLGFMQVNCTDH